MIDSKIWACGAISIEVGVAEWRGDKITPHTYICRIEHAAADPTFTATRTNALEAERECVAAFIEYWEKRNPRQRTHPGRAAFRAVAKGQEATPEKAKPEPRLTPASKPEKPKRSAATLAARPAPKPPVEDFEY